MHHAHSTGLFDDDPIFREFEDFVRANLSDEKALGDALGLLKLVFLRQRSIQFGIRATLQYMVEHGELRRASHPRDEICLVPDQNEDKRHPDPSR